ncbi:MAG: inositol monophosphatase family protein [Gemmatimonadaceae bacterium]
MNPADCMQAVAELSRIAGENAMSYFRSSVNTEIKPDGSPVTIADRSSERLVREWIEARFPADGIIGEEYGTIRPDATRRWIIDPIDGTKAFIKGVPFWGSPVALVEGDGVIAGAASFPALGESLVAARGEGCWWNDVRCYVSEVSDLSTALVLTSDCVFTDQPTRQSGWLALTASAASSRTWGDCAGYLLVATGRAEVMVDPTVSAWDVAALAPAIVEAGGVFTDWEGTATPFNGSAIASNRALASAARNILQHSSSGAAT